MEHKKEYIIPKKYTMDGKIYKLDLIESSWEEIKVFNLSVGMVIKIYNENGKRFVHPSTGDNVFIVGQTPYKDENDEWVIITSN